MGDSDTSDLESLTSDNYKVTWARPVYVECPNIFEDSKSNDENEEDVYVVVVTDEYKTKTDFRFHCEICNVTFSNKEEINNHLYVLDHVTSKICEICCNIMDENMYNIHIALHKGLFKHRTQENKTQCKECGKYVSKGYLKFHMKTHGDYQDKLTRLKKCNVCLKFVLLSYFSDHMKRMHGKVHNNSCLDVNIQKCPICNHSIKNKNINEHIASHGNKAKTKPYVCDVCGKVFNSGSPYRTHMLIHYGELKYKCAFCPYRGLHLGLLKIHVRTHTKDYPYECSVCERKFITKSNLSIHEKRHRSPEFNCQACCKAFYTERNLNRHYSLIHLGIRNVKCDICEKRFGHKDALYAHKKRVHHKSSAPHVGRMPSYLKQSFVMNYG